MLLLIRRFNLQNLTVLKNVRLDFLPLLKDGDKKYFFLSKFRYSDYMMRPLELVYPRDFEIWLGKTICMILQ